MRLAARTGWQSKWSEQKVTQVNKTRVLSPPTVKGNSRGTSTLVVRNKLPLFLSVTSTKNEKAVECLLAGASWWTDSHSHFPPLTLLTFWESCCFEGMKEEDFSATRRSFGDYNKRRRCHKLCKSTTEREPVKDGTCLQSLQQCYTRLVLTATQL